MDSKTFDILLRARDNSIHVSNYVPYSDNFGISPDLADLVRRGFLIASFSYDFPHGYNLHLTSVGREQIEDEERRIADSRLTRRFWRGVGWFMTHVVPVLLPTVTTIIYGEMNRRVAKQHQEPIEISVPGAKQDESEAAHRDRLGEERAAVSNKFEHGVFSSNTVDYAAGG